MKLQNINTFLFGTMRGRLIISVAIVHAIMMTLFIIDLTTRQRDMLLERQVEEATALAQSLSTSAAVWIASDDLAGLQEIVETQRRYPELIFAILTDDDGRILAHTDSSKKGKFLQDLPKEVRETVLSKTTVLADIAVPSLLAGRHVGWARIGIGQRVVQKKLADITFNGALYALAAIVIGSFIAWLMGSNITRRLYAVQDTIKKVRKGDRTARSAITGEDEAASIASEFNALLDTVEERSAALVRSETKYRLLLENIQAAVIVHGPDTRIRMSNPLAQELLGLSEEQLLGKAAVDPAWHFLREDGAALPLPEYPVLRTLAERRPVKDLVIGISRPDQERVTWVQVNTGLTMSEQGEINEVIVTFVDMSGRKQAEAERSASEIRFRAVFERSVDAIGVSKAGTHEFVNPAYLNLFGYASNDELQGKSILELIAPDEHPAVLENVRRRARGEAVPSNYETRGLRKDGTSFDMDVHASLYELGGEAYTLVILRDISERKQAEQALHMRERELNESQRVAHIGSWDWDAVNDIIWWSDEYYRIYGFDPKTPPPNYEEHKKAYTAESAERLDSAVKRAMESGEPYEVDLELAHPTASTQWVTARCEAKRDANGKIWGLRGTAQNITERKSALQAIQRAKEDLELRINERTADSETKSMELQENQMALMNIVEDLNGKTAELESANSRLHELDQLKSMFIASMSHELRTPLNSIIGFSSIMLNEWTGPVTAEQKENLSAVLRSGKHLLSLINDVIDVSKIEAGKIESLAEEFEVRAVVLEAVEALKKDAEKKGLKLKVRASRQVLHADRRRLLQCLLNLVSNAVKYTQQGSIEVSTEIASDGAMLSLIVEDTGIGIQEDDLNRLFLPFVRLTPPAGAVIPGTGLGLYLTKKLVQEVLRGDILVHSTYGAGSRFTLCVPIAG